MVLISLLPCCPRLQGVVVFLVFVIVVVFVAAVNRVFRSGISRLLGHIRLLGLVRLIGSLIHIGRILRRDSKLLVYAVYFNLSLFIGHHVTCSGKLGYLCSRKPGYLSRSVVIRHPLRALFRLPSCLLRPRHVQVVVTSQGLWSVVQRSGRLVCQVWLVRSVKRSGSFGQKFCVVRSVKVWV